MPERIQVADHLVVGGQPAPEDFRQLAEEGFRTVINLRVAHEAADMLSPLDEADLVRKEGMAYLHLDVSTKQPRPELVDEFRNAVDKLEGPIFAHCGVGKRAGAFALMHRAAQEGWSGPQALAQAKQLGLKIDDPLWIDFVRRYADEHRGQSPTSPG